MNYLYIIKPCQVLRKRDSKDTHQIPVREGGKTNKGSERNE